MKLDAEQIYAKLIESGDAWSDAEAAADLLERTRPSVLAKLKNETGAKSDAASETLALADQGYIDFVTGMVQARKVANKAKVRYESAKTLSELRRSEESTRRAELTHA